MTEHGIVVIGQDLLDIACHGARICRIVIYVCFFPRNIPCILSLLQGPYSEDIIKGGVARDTDLRCHLLCKGTTGKYFPHASEGP